MTLIGLITLLGGLIALAWGPRAPVVALVLATLLGSAAAFLIGSANIQPAHLLLAFVAIATVTRRHESAEAIRAVTFPQPGFWLAFAVAYGVMGGIFLPRIFQGVGQIIPVGSTGYDDTGGAVPLGPTSGNATQAIYFIADLACFAMVRAAASRAEGMLLIANAIVIFAVANIAFAILDVATFQTGTAWLFDIIRNAQYAFHAEESSSGLKRIVGSFLEASSFAHATLGAFGFTGTMWLCGRRTLLNGVLALVSLALLLLSTSSTGLIGAPAVIVILYLTVFRRCLQHVGDWNGAAVVVVAPVAAICVALAVALSPEATAVVRDYLNTLVFTKSVSQSGIERATWNALAWSNFVDSYGLGVGLGTSRTSSLVLAVLSNLGIPGTLAYAAFLWTALAGGRTKDITEVSDIRLGARNAAFALLIADATSGPLVDQGLSFYIMAAVACADPDRRGARIPARGAAERASPRRQPSTVAG